MPTAAMSGSGTSESAPIQQEKARKSSMERHARTAGWRRRNLPGPPARQIRMAMGMLVNRLRRKKSW